MHRFVALLTALTLISTSPLAATPAFAAPAKALPRPAHTIVIIEENKTFAQIVGNSHARYINDLAAHGALFTNAFGVMHPSLPNYFALFSGLTNTNGDDCPATGLSQTAPNLASELFAAHMTFTGYAENLPSAGSKVCAAGTYARKHAPWVHFTNIPPSVGQPFSALPKYDDLPTVAFVVPDVDDDMHDGTIEAGDDWLEAHLAKLVDWAQSHDALIVLTWDEGYDDRNTIPTIFFGPMIAPGKYGERLDHFRTLRTIETLYGLAPTGRAKNVAPVSDCFR